MSTPLSTTAPAGDQNRLQAELAVRKQRDHAEQDALRGRAVDDRAHAARPEHEEVERAGRPPAEHRRYRPRLPHEQNDAERGQQTGRDQQTWHVRQREPRHDRLDDADQYRESQHAENEQDPTQ